MKKASSVSGSAGTLYLVHALTHASRSRLDDALRHLELSSLQYTILSVLAHNENLSSSRLSRRFYVTPQTMGETIQLLERKGLIERREDPANRKALLLSLTKFGKSVCAEGDAHVRSLERRVFGGLSDAEHATLRSILSRTNVSLRADDDRGHDDALVTLTRTDARSTVRAPRRRLSQRRVAGGD